MTEGRQFEGPSFDDGHAGRVIASLAVAVMIDQVWSLAQFYSVDFSKSRIGVKKCVNTQRFASAVFYGVLGRTQDLRA